MGVWFKLKPAIVLNLKSVNYVVTIVIKKHS